MPSPIFGATVPSGSSATSGASIDSPPSASDGRNEVQVRWDGTIVKRRHRVDQRGLVPPLAVDQHQGLVRIEAAKSAGGDHRRDPAAGPRRQIYEGKAKILYEGPEPGTLIQYFKDDATAFNAQKKGTISGKGVLNNRISEHIFTLLGMIGVAAGSLSTRLGIEEGTQLPRTIIEYYYKDDALGDPMITDEHIAAFGWASQEEMHDIADLAIRVNDFLCGLFAGIGIRLVDFKLEFGRIWDNDYGRVILADEISPDGCRLWDMETNEKLDKDRFRRDLGGEVEAYQEVRTAPCSTWRATANAAENEAAPVRPAPRRPDPDRRIETALAAR
eukprot:gene30333-40307_t